MRIIFVLGLLLLLATVPVQAQTHSVSLSWTASTSTGVTGYNVYRLTGVCPTVISLSAFTKVGSVTVLTYADTTVAAGTQYCYTVTATTATQESAAPGTLQVSIPIFTASTAPLPPGAPGASVQ